MILWETEIVYFMQFYIKKINNNFAMGNRNCIFYVTLYNAKGT